MTHYWGGVTWDRAEDKGFTAYDDLETSITNYRWALGHARRDPFVVEKFRRQIHNTFFKIRGFFPTEAYYRAIEAAPEKSNYDAFGMSAIRAVMEGI